MSWQDLFAKQPKLKKKVRPLASTVSLSFSEYLYEARPLYSEGEMEKCSYCGVKGKEPVCEKCGAPR